MQEDFVAPRSASKPIPVSDLKAEERIKLESLGLVLEQHEAIASDLLERISRSTLDANTVNRLAVDELSEEDDLSGLHPDVAQSIREAASNGMFESKPIADIMEEVDEDGVDKGKVPEADIEKPSKATRSAEEVDEVLRTLLDKRYKDRQRYIAKITEDDRTAILEEVITGKRYTRVFKFFGGKMVITMGTISSAQSEAITEYLSVEVNSRAMTIDQYNAYRNKVKAAVRVVSVIANDKVVYSYVPKSTIADIMDAVFNKSGNSELFRSLLAESDREMNGVLDALLEDASHEVFTVPAYADIG